MMKKGKRKSKMQEKEVWERINFADDHYEISNHGRVKSFLSDPKGKILENDKNNGFETVNLLIEAEYKQFCVHKLVAEYFILKEDQKQTVAIHKDWDKTNNHVNNLLWISAEESYNRLHQREQNEEKRLGRGVSNSKLKPEDIFLLKTMLQKGIKQNVIARLFAISEMQVTRIKRNENWAHIIVPEDE